MQIYSSGKQEQNLFSAFKLLNEKLSLNSTSIINLEELQKLEQGTFGRALFDFITIYDLEPFKGLRRIQLHDCVHVLTGYGADLLGEAEVQAFLFATQNRPFHLFIGLGIIRKIRQQINTEKISLTEVEIWQRLYYAYQRGRTSSFNINTWQPESQWSINLNQLRQQYQL